jgi:5'-nucleotidase
VLITLLSVGTLIDWDEGFRTKWLNRSEIHRSLSYHMEDCVPLVLQSEAKQLITSKGFFFELPAMKGALQAVKEMIDEGFSITIVTSLVTHIPNADHCAPEKIEWIRYYLGESFVKNLAFISDKTKISGDILIDDKPTLQSEGQKGFSSSWRQVVFDAPYNRQMESYLYPRLYRWKDWRDIIYPLTTLANLPEIHVANTSLNISESILTKCSDAVCEAQFKQDFLIGVDVIGGDDKNYDLVSTEIAASSVHGNDSFLCDNQDTPDYIIPKDTEQKKQHSIKWKKDEQDKILNSHANEPMINANPRS